MHTINLPIYVQDELFKQIQKAFKNIMLCSENPPDGNTSPKSINFVGYLKIENKEIKLDIPKSYASSYADI